MFWSSDGSHMMTVHHRAWMCSGYAIQACVRALYHVCTTKSPNDTFLRAYPPRQVVHDYLLVQICCHRDLLKTDGGTPGDFLDKNALLPGYTVRLCPLQLSPGQVVFLLGTGHSGLHLLCCRWGWPPPSLHAGLYSNVISDSETLPSFSSLLSPTSPFLFRALIIL